MQTAALDNIPGRCRDYNMMLDSPGQTVAVDKASAVQEGSFMDCGYLVMTHLLSQDDSVLYT